MLGHTGPMDTIRTPLSVGGERTLWGQGSQQHRQGHAIFPGEHFHGKPCEVGKASVEFGGRAEVTVRAWVCIG